jgi:ribosomal protein S18 acetylase RimI-like enzyme
MSEFAAYAPGPGTEPPLSETDGLRIRVATAADLERLAPIAAAREGSTVEAALEGFTRFLETAAAGRALVMMAEIGGEAIGFGKASYFSPPADSATNVAPEGWYLSGVVVSPRYRRRGVGARLTAARLAWIAATGGEAAYYFANARNRVSIELHERFGFVELTRDFSHPYARFEGGVGILFVRRGPPAREPIE